MQKVVWTRNMPYESFMKDPAVFWRGTFLHFSFFHFLAFFFLSTCNRYSQIEMPNVRSHFFSINYSECLPWSSYGGQKNHLDNDYVDLYVAILFAVNTFALKYLFTFVSL